MNDVKDWAISKAHGETADSIKDAASTAAQDPAKAAQKVSNTLEQNVASEPVNSTFRTVLMALAGASILTSLIFQISNKKQTSTFVGQWAPTLLLIALWGQVAKVQESR